jgi:hypothetical protein
MFQSPGITVLCEKCGYSWDVARPVSTYERLNIETRPCPGCGTHTLSCRDALPAAGRRGYRRRAWPQTGLSGAA